MNEQRLDTVVRVRALRERIARSEVARRRIELEQQRALEAAAWAVVGERTSSEHRRVPRFVAHRAMLEAGVHEAQWAAMQVTAADERVATAMSHWQDEARRLDGIERLAERVHAEAAAERERVERNEIDDIVVMRNGASTPEVER